MIVIQIIPLDFTLQLKREWYYPSKYRFNLAFSVCAASNVICDIDAGTMQLYPAGFLANYASCYYWKAPAFHFSK